MSSIAPKAGTIFAQTALLPDGWAQNIRIAVDERGKIQRIERDAAISGRDRVTAILVPAMGNLHSHAFQRAMAGLSEYRSASEDSFWTWRDIMYRFVAHLTPDQAQAIAACAYMEMAEAGYAAVGEFHYLHHRPDGGDYDDPAEMAARMFASAEAAGLGVTLLPVYYAYGGARQAPLGDAQKRFGCTLERYRKLREAISGAAKTAPADALVGTALHSLRAIAPGDIDALYGVMGDGPVHIHAAEQLREVEDVKAWLGARPIEWLLGNAPLSESWCLVHATHMTDEETRRLAQSGAVAGICPITEASLGDGIFDGEAYFKHGGSLGVGTDSNVQIALTDELRLLEYSQRLARRRRNIFSDEARSTGRTLYEKALKGGAAALGRLSGKVEEGFWADLVALDSNRLSPLCREGDKILDGWVFGSGDKAVSDVWSAGRRIVEDGRHVARDEIERRYEDALNALQQNAL